MFGVKVLCSDCGASFPKALPRCPGCGNDNPAYTRGGLQSHRRLSLILGGVVLLGLGAVAVAAFVIYGRSVIAANEGAALQRLRNLASAQSLYRQRTANMRYETSLTALAALDYIDPDFGSGRDRGYAFTLKTPPRDRFGCINAWTCNADPVRPGRTGSRFFRIDEKGVITFNRAGPATGADTPVAD